MKKQPLLERIGERPTLAIKFMFWLAQTLIGLLILLPGYMPETNTPSLAAGLSSIIALKVYGFLMLLPGALGLFLMWKPDRFSWACRVRQGLTFWTFLLFLYFAMVRFIAFGPSNLVWIAYLLCSLTMGVVHLRLKWENK